jgi:hypothetical protein
MKVFKSILPAAILTALGAGMAGQAHATVYGAAKLEVTALHVLISTAGSPLVPSPLSTVTGFNFSSVNTADLTGFAPIISTATCSGTAGPPGFGNNCTPGITRSDAVVRNLGAPASLENAFTVHAPGSGEHASSDSVIHTANLTLDPFTSTSNIAEAELQTGTFASSSSEIQSTTGLNFSFLPSDPGQLIVTFTADPYMEASISGSTGTSQTNMKFQLTLTADDGSYFGMWRPDGTVNTNCIAVGGFAATCSESADGSNINNQFSVSSSNDLIFNPGVPTAFGIKFTGLAGGLGGTVKHYSLSLDEVKSVSLTRQPTTPPQAPEPSSILMLGMGLMTMFFGLRRNRNQAV